MLAACSGCMIVGGDRSDGFDAALAELRVDVLGRARQTLSTRYAWARNSMRRTR
jgi:hypothetical protein